MRFGTFVVELTPICNLRCLYCSAYDEGKPHVALPCDEWERILLHVAKSHPERIILSGGEPLLYPHLREIYLFCLEHFSYVGITTNGTVMTKQMLDLFRDHPPASIQVSIDGTEAYHDLMRGKGSYAKAVSAIKSLKSIGVTVYTMTVVTKRNLDLLDELIGDMHSLQVDSMCMERISPVGAGKNDLGLLLEPADLHRLYDKWKHDRDKEFVHINDPIFHAFERTLPQGHRQYLACDGCMAGIKNFSIDTEGYLNICTRVPVRIGKVLDTDLDHIFTQYPILEKLAIRQIDGKCSKCERLMYCGGCRADAFGLTGDLFAEDHVCWSS